MLEIKLSKRNKGVVVPGSGANLMNEIVSLEQQMNFTLAKGQLTTTQKHVV